MPTTIITMPRLLLRSTSQSDFDQLFTLVFSDEEVMKHLTGSPIVLLYLSLNDIRVEYCHSYGEPRHVIGTLNPREPATQWKVEFKSPEGAMLLFNGRALLQFASFPNLPALAPSEV
jgi:hypothetical protein